MRLDFRGSHAARTLAQAAEIRGLATGSPGTVVFVALDVDDHTILGPVNRLMLETIDSTPSSVPIVVVSQVPPGWTRPWTMMRPNIFYQQNTLIMSCALERAVYPERFVIGCAEAAEPLPRAYQSYLEVFGCPVIRMSYESAELSKLAINYLLASQIEASNVLSELASKVGADWDEMMPGLRLDKRMGAYLRPGTVGGHLPRDVRTINRLKGSA